MYAHVTFEEEIHLVVATVTTVTTITTVTTVTTLNENWDRFFHDDRLRDRDRNWVCDRNWNWMRHRDLKVHFENYFAATI